MAKPKALEKVSNRLILTGSVISAIVIFIGALTAIGVDWPLTEKSPIIQESVQFDQYQELETQRFKAEISSIKVESLYNRIESNGVLLSQFEGKTNLTPGEIREKIRWETQIKRYEAKIDKLEAKE